MAPRPTAPLLDRRTKTRDAVPKLLEILGVVHSGGHCASDDRRVQVSVRRDLPPDLHGPRPPKRWMLLENCDAQPSPLVPLDRYAELVGLVGDGGAAEAGIKDEGLDMRREPDGPVNVRLDVVVQEAALGGLDLVGALTCVE